MFACILLSEHDILGQHSCCSRNSIPITQLLASDVTKIKNNKLESVMKHFVIIILVRRQHGGTVGGTATSQLSLMS